MSISSKHDAPVRSGRMFEASGGVRLHLAEAGDPDAPPMLLLHGFPEFWGAWQDLMPRLAAGGRRVVAPDQRGYNLSDKPAGVDAYGVRPLTADVVALVDALNAEAGADRDPSRRCVLVAHDWGGAIGWNVAIRHPDKLSRFVILNAPHPWKFWKGLRDDPAQQAASEYMNWLRRPGCEKPLAADGFKLLERFFLGMEGAPWFTPEVRAAYHAAWGQPGALESMVNWYRASPLHPPLPQDAPSGAAAFELDPAQFVVRVPTLVLWGERDHALLPPLAEGLDRFVPDLRLHRLPDCSHWLAHERPDEIAGHILDFCAVRP